MNTFLDKFGSGGKSIVVSGASFASDARMIELVIMGLVILAMAWAAATSFGVAFEYMVENSGRQRGLRAKISRLGKVIPRFKQRYDVSLEKSLSAKDYVSSLRSKCGSLRNKHTKLVTATDRLVRQIGEDAGANRCYLFLVTNRSVLSYAARGVKHPLLDDSWKVGQMIEVWASTMAEARVAVLERYPVTLGFAVDMGEQSEDRAGGNHTAAIASA